jgi:transcriptional regulator with XRE-family HTH domain
MTPAQCRAARGLAGWSQADLGARSSVSRATILKFEDGQEVRAGTVTLLKLALSETVSFIPEDETDGEGVRLKKRASVKVHDQSRGAGETPAIESGTSTPYSPFDRGGARAALALMLFSRGRWFRLPRAIRRVLRPWLFSGVPNAPLPGGIGG